MKQISTPQRSKSLWLSVIAFILICLLIASKATFANVGPEIKQVNNFYSATGTMPVILTPLKGYYSKGVSHLYWSSLQESNSSYYEIQRSDDGINFLPVGKVMAASSSDKEVDYSYNDIKAAAGANYYRLKLLDKDGKYQFSNIEMLNVNIEGINITGIYPAPFTDKVNVTVSSAVNAVANICLYDNTGKMVITRQSFLSKGVSNFAVDKLSGLQPGFYIIKVQVGDALITKKLMK